MSAPHDRDLAELRALNRRFIHEFVENDADGHAGLLHPAFTCLTSAGQLQEREAYLARWASGFDPDIIPYWDLRDERITVLGDVALVRATNKHTVRRGGRETTGMTAYIDTYLRENGDWLCIQAQSTPVAPEHEPGDETIVSRYLGGRLQP